MMWFPILIVILAAIGSFALIFNDEQMRRVRWLKKQAKKRKDEL